MLRTCTVVDDKQNTCRMESGYRFTGNPHSVHELLKNTECWYLRFRFGGNYGFKRV